MRAFVKTITAIAISAVVFASCSSNDDGGGDETGTLSSSSSEGGQGNSSPGSNSSSSDNSGDGTTPACVLFCGGASVANGSPNNIPTTGTCVFIADFEQIEGDLAGQGSNIIINGEEFPCTDTGNGEDDWTACKVNATKENKPAKVDGGYYVYVESGNINTFQNNGWLNVIGGLSRCVPMPSVSSSSTVTFPSSSGVAIVQSSSSAGGGSDKENFHIYLAFGQSNMEGQCAGTNNQVAYNTNNFPASYRQGVDPRFQVMTAVSGNYGGQTRTQGQWYTAVPSLVRENLCLSPVDYFGRTIVENTPSNIKVGVIVVAVAGAKIDGFMKGTTANNYYNGLPANENYMKSFAAHYDNNPYNRLVTLAKEAQKVGTIKGILMHQGESGANGGVYNQKVKTIYDDILSDLSLPANSVPFLAGQAVGNGNQNISSIPSAITGNLPGTTTKVAHIIPSNGCTAIDDNLHFTYEGYKLLGERYGEKMLELLY